MPLPSPFHPRTSALCNSMSWKDWAGYYAVCAYNVCHEREYFAIRESAGLLDVTPLFKYDISGKNARSFLSFIMTRNILKLKVGRVAYCSWTNHRGKMLDDGTVTRIEKQRFRVTAADPSLHWFKRHSRGFDVEIRDVTNDIAALALQGPTSRDILKQVCDADMDTLGFFRTTKAKLGNATIDITRTGYTGDLGYEIWMDNKDALDVYDALMADGRNYGIDPLGLDALDMSRIEAGFILNGVDYRSARSCLQEHQTSSPYEAGLGWTVDLNREPFIGQNALTAEVEAGPTWATVGLDISWTELEALHDALEVPPDIPAKAWRTATPLYAGQSQVGYATSGTWSPLLKKNIAIATVNARFSPIGTELSIEVLVEHWRKKVKATVVERPFFDPERKRA